MQVGPERLALGWKVCTDQLQKKTFLLFKCTRFSIGIPVLEIYSISYNTKINHKNKIFPINTPSMCKTDPSVKSTWQRAAQGVRLGLAPRLLELCPAVYAAPGSLGIGFTASPQHPPPHTAHSQGLFGACFQSPISSVLWVLLFGRRLSVSIWWKSLLSLPLAIWDWLKNSLFDEAKLTRI